MKRFKKLIPSLAASVMVAAATLAPLPSFLTAGVAHADAAFSHSGFVRILSPARLDVELPILIAQVNGIDVKNEYLCFPGTNGATLGQIQVSATQTASQSGSGQAVVGYSISTVNCDGKPHIVTVPVPPDVLYSPFGFNVGKANTGAALYNPDGILVAQESVIYELHPIRVV